MSPFSTTVRGSSPRRNVARDGGGGSGGLDIVTPEHTQNARRAVHPVSTASCIRLLTVRGSLWTRSVTPVDDLPSTVAGVDAVPGSATHRERETGDRGVDRGDDRAQVGRQRLGDPQQQLAQLVAAPCEEQHVLELRGADQGGEGRDRHVQDRAGEPAPEYGRVGQAFAAVFVVTDKEQLVGKGKGAHGRPRGLRWQATPTDQSAGASTRSQRNGTRSTR